MNSNLENLKIFIIIFKYAFLLETYICLVLIFFFFMYSLLSCPWKNRFTTYFFLKTKLNFSRSAPHPPATNATRSRTRCAARWSKKFAESSSSKQLRRSKQKLKKESTRKPDFWRRDFTTKPDFCTRRATREITNQSNLSLPLTTCTGGMLLMKTTTVYLHFIVFDFIFHLNFLSISDLR